jgi:hypothetical protein
MPKIAILHPGIYGNPENDALTTSFLADVTAVRYAEGMTKEELLAAVPSGLTHVSFVYHYPGNSSLPFFPDTSGGQPKYQYFSDAAIDILRSVSANGLTVDILACDLKEAAYIEEVQKIETELGINIRYSAGKIGNPSSGGSWTLESKETAVNVLPVYFTDGVLAWNGVLINIAPAIKAGTYSADISWNGVDTFKVQRDFIWNAPPLNLTATDFIELSGNEIFDGSGYEIDISGLFWSGLVLISPSVANIGAAPIIKNLGVINGYIGGPTPPSNGGAIVRPKGAYFKIDNCWNTGQINGADSGSAAGGIAGAFSGVSGECIITGCYNTGKIFGLNAGGIVGSNAGDDGGICTITECRHINNIDCGAPAPGIIGGAGGIAGANAGANGGLCEITDCYTTGQIISTSTYAGGIVGANAGISGECIISCCYISGALEGVECGGIAGANAGISGECTISNCYSIGPQSGSASGGIVGRYAGQTGICDISNCYSIGSIVSNSGGIAGADAGISGICTITDCYSAGQHNVPESPGGGGIVGLNPGSSGGSCTITRSVCNGEPIYVTGGSPNVTVQPDCCSNLIVINGTGCFVPPRSWDPTIWEVGGLVNVTIDGSPAQYNLPLVSCFKNFPCNSDFYTAADEPAECGTPYTTPNSFPLRVNPYVTLGTVLVYTQEAIDALVAGLPLLIPTTRVSWAPDGMPAGSLFRDLNRAVVVKVSPTNPLHAYRFQWIQLIRGPTTEGVGGSPADSWQTGYICVWAASGAPPVFL